MLVGAWPYGGADPESPPWPAGRVARFARGNPYAGLRAALDAVADRLRVDGHRARVLMDDNALVDRAAAHRAGLGWWGKNTNLLLPEGGSWYLLGSVLTDLALAPTGAAVPDGCGSCRRCLDACPTGALEPGVLDARRCLTWLLQARGPFPRAFRNALGDRIYGCDDCQVVCPPGRSGGREPSDPEDTWLDVVAMLALDDGAGHQPPTPKTGRLTPYTRWGLLFPQWVVATREAICNPAELKKMEWRPSLCSAF